MVKKRDKKKKIRDRRRKIRRQTKPKTSYALNEDPGFDYGIQPRVMSIADPEFINLWNRSGCIAMCYTMISQIGVRTEVPVASMGFSKPEVGKKFFGLVKSWMKPPGNESALDISFIEDAKYNRYFILMGPNPQQLVCRIFGEGADSDYCPLIMSGFLVKKFPLSEYFRRFRQIATGKEIFLCPISIPSNLDKHDNESFMLPVEASEIDHQVGFFKSDIKFLDRCYLEPDTMEYIMTEISYGSKPKSHKGPDPPIPDPDEVFRQRKRQLKRFFPVTMARLSYNESFTNAREELRSKYAEWQIIQAACNLYARGNWPEFGRRQSVNMLAIYQKLRNHAQNAIESAPLTFAYKSNELEQQIIYDMKYLHSYICPNSRENPESELRIKGYL